MFLKIPQNIHTRLTNLPHKQTNALLPNTNKPKHKTYVQNLNTKKLKENKKTKTNLPPHQPTPYIKNIKPTLKMITDYKIPSNNTIHIKIKKPKRKKKKL